jgi:type IV fimbrial biogenesis protein FimT
MRRALGFTLWELLCTVGIGSIVFVAGAPALGSFVLDARMTADVNGWVLAVQLARSESYKRGRPVIVCRTLDTRRCAGAAPGEPADWMVFVNLDDVFPPQRSEKEPLLFVHQPEIEGAIAGNRPYYEFRPGRRSTNGTTVFCDRRGAAAAKAVIVSYTGRPRVATRDSDGRPLDCARLT